MCAGVRSKKLYDFCFIPIEKLLAWVTRHQHGNNFHNQYPTTFKYLKTRKKKQRPPTLLQHWLNITATANSLTDIFNSH